MRKYIVPIRGVMPRAENKAPMAELRVSPAMARHELDKFILQSIYSVV